MSNPYAEYYRNQAGSGLTHYEGYQYQRGHGFFGTLFNTIIKPLGKYLLPKVLSTGVKVGQDVLDGKKFGESFKRNLKSSGEEILDDGVERLKKFAQTGKGRRRKRRTKNTLMKKIIKRRKKRKIKSLKKKQQKTTQRKKKSKKKKKKKKKKKRKNLFKNLFE